MSKKKDKDKKKKKALKIDITRKNIHFSLFDKARASLSAKLKEMEEERVHKIEYAERMEKILAVRFKDRDIPKADEGFRRNDLSEDALQRFYIEANVGEFLKAEGKFIHFEFGKLLDPYRVNTDENDENPLIKKISYAEISKQSFVNNINLSIRYINYFIEYFDDDDELLNAYLTIMFLLHHKNTKITVDEFVNHIISLFATESMFDKVIRMVEYNTDETLIKKSERAYDESIQLTVEHLKAIMGVSCFHRFVIPIVSHYYTLKGKGQLGGITDKDLYFMIFSSFIPMFDDFYDISLYGKIYHTATTRISKTENQETTMWKRRDRFGVTPISFTTDLMREYINEISQKTMFNQSAIVFLHVCFDKAIKNELLKSDRYEMSDMRMEPSDNVNETISRFDRWTIDKTFNSEKDRLRAYIVVKDTVQRAGLAFGINFKIAEMYRIKKQELNSLEFMEPEQIDEQLERMFGENSSIWEDEPYTIPIKKLQETLDEYDYYDENIERPFHDTQLYAIQLYYASKTLSSDTVKMLEIPDIIRLIMIMKRDMQQRSYVYLPLFVSGKLITTTNKKIATKTLRKMCEAHPSYKDFIDNFKDTIEMVNMDKIYGELQVIVSTPVRVVDYDYVQLRDKIMYPSDIATINEFIRLMNDC